MDLPICRHIIVQSWKHLYCLLMDKWIKTMFDVCTHTMEHYCHKKSKSCHLKQHDGTMTDFL